MISTVRQEEVLRQIDAIPMSSRLQGLRQRYFDELPQVCADRLKYAMESWKETAGQPVEIRGAKKLRKILEGMTIAIHDGELTAGGQSRFFRGSAPYVDWDAEYFGQEVQGRKVAFGSPREIGNISEEDWEVCCDAALFFKGRSPAEAARGIAAALFGDWYENAMQVCALVPRYEDMAYLPGVPMYDKLLNLGVAGIIREVQSARERFRESGEHDPEKIYFWDAVNIILQGLVNFAHRHATLARELASKEQDATRREELLAMAEACEWVPENPARTFQEAIQAMRFAIIALCLENGRKAPDLGRLDMLLYPYFKKDVEEGRLTLEKAADLLGDFITFVARLEQILRFGFRECNQATMINHITLGGTVGDGQDGSNELTHLILHVLGLMGYAEPHATVRLHEGTPSWLLAKSLELNLKLNGIPMYLNDNHVTSSIHRRGFPLEEARDWAVVGCSQPTMPKRGHYNGMQINIAVPLDLALHNGVSPLTKKKVGIETGDPRTFKTFDEMFEAYKKQYEFVVRRLHRLQKLMHLAESQIWRMPLRSALDYASISNGKSHTLGGSDSYPLWENKDRALVDVADSLTSIRKLVFEQKKLTMGELIDALDSDFAGEKGEEVKRLCLSAPKYGNDIDEADFMLRDVGKFSAGVIQSEKNVFGYPYAINRNGLAWHYAAGKGVWALPNGRHARAPFADGSLSPMAGMDRNGPTAVLKSALKADFGDAMVAIINQKFPITLVRNPEIMQKVGALTTTFINNGGLHIQYNFVDRKILLDAKKHPERYKDLVVRVGGYSAYFVNLSPEVQDEIINRTEHTL